MVGWLLWVPMCLLCLARTGEPGFSKRPCLNKLSEEPLKKALGVNFQAPYTHARAPHTHSDPSNTNKHTQKHATERGGGEEEGRRGGINKYTHKQATERNGEGRGEFLSRGAIPWRLVSHFCQSQLKLMSFSYSGNQSHTVNKGKSD